ncbi:MAG: hypothetical protein K0Q72_2212 [Armatimonadetes bacterium]|nr:hypothetical protein [Armatimonadota bacterium]
MRSSGAGERAVRCPGPRAFGRSRRELLRFSLAGLGGYALDHLCQQRAEAGEAQLATRSDTAVLLVWCHGGPSHLETYDPKPDSPAEFRGPFGAISTNVAGVRLSELLPLQAKLADKYTLLRSVHHRGPCHDSGLQTLLSGHEQLVNRFGNPEHPDCFAVSARFRYRTGDVLPPYVGAPPLDYTSPVYLGPSCAPFAVSGDPNAPNFEVPNLALSAPGARERIGRRSRLLSRVDDVRRDLVRAEHAVARDRQYHAALDLITSGKARTAFDISQEAETTRERYGRNRWGQQLLLARRLVESGVSVVTTSLYGIEKGMASNWDDHAVNWDCFKAMQERAPVFDRAVSALIHDLYDRGLDKRVLLIVTWSPRSTITWGSIRHGRSSTAPAGPGPCWTAGSRLRG